MQLHIDTPLIEANSSTHPLKGNVWLKMEFLQPPGSFKIRGIGHACQSYVANGAKRVVASSGGNAGLAVAYSGYKLNVPVTVRFM